MTPAQSHEALNRIIDQQAYMLSANDIFYIIGDPVRAADRRRVACAPRQIDGRSGERRSGLIH